MTRVRNLASPSIAGLLLGISAISLSAQTRPSALAIMAEFDRITADELWPGFSPRETPLAIFDNHRTWLFRHPSPPSEFEPARERADAHVFAGRHGVVRANTNTELGGVATATIVVDPAGGGTAEAYAATAVHEAFHVFQRSYHPRWGGNEIELFTYPVDDAELLAGRRLETEALQRALAAGRLEDLACWTRRALAERASRFGTLPPGSVQYERGTELLEGLAEYVASKADGGGRPSVTLPPGDFAADEVRERAYATGRAMAVLLDRTSPPWALRLERSDSQALDQILTSAVDTLPGSLCAFTTAERSSAAVWARDAVADLRARRSALQVRARTRPGWRVAVIAADSAPLFPEAFDPLNVQLLGSGEVLHNRWLKLGNAAGALEALEHDAVTEAVGAHPLFTGVRRVTLTGLEQEPRIQQRADTTFIATSGFELRFRHARWSIAGDTVTVLLDPSGR